MHDSEVKENLLKTDGIYLGCEHLGKEPVVVGCEPGISFFFSSEALSSCPTWQSTRLIQPTLIGVSQWNMSLLLSREGKAIGK